MTHLDVELTNGGSTGGPGPSSLPRRFALPDTTAVARRLARPVHFSIRIRVPGHPSARFVKTLLAMSVTLTLTGGMAAASVHATGEANPRKLASVAVSKVRSLESAHPARFADTPTDNPLAEVAAPAALAAVLPAIPPAAGGPAVPSIRGALPSGKGMWIWLPERAEGGNPHAIVARARAVGLTHVYVRTGSSRSGFHAAAFLDQLLPVAHAAGIRVYGWDFPYFDNVDDDVRRATVAVTHLAPGGHRIDGFTADIETHGEGVNITPQNALAYGDRLRRTVGEAYPLIAVVPRPNPALVTYPFPEVVAAFDAISPMVYWMGRDPGNDVAGAIRALSVFKKPVIPVGQTYDGQAEGGPPGVPRREAIIRFMQVADEMGATAVSFWSWQHADQQAWDAVRDAGEFTLPVAPQTLGAGQIRNYQALLGSLGFPGPFLPRTGIWDAATIAAVVAYQKAANLQPTGFIDEPTKAAMLTPFGPPLPPPRT